jgi:CRP-like cAMP-binding protein
MSSIDGDSLPRVDSVQPGLSMTPRNLAFSSRSDPLDTGEAMRRLNSTESEGDVADREIFHHEICPDMSPGEALDILRSFKELHLDSEWNSFNIQDLSLLSEVFSVIKLTPGETVVIVGEPASFYGILLEGELTVTIPQPSGTPISIALKPSSLVGEMAYFNHGNRSATVVAATASTMALMTYQELDSLATYSGELQAKLTKLLAKKSIIKLEYNMRAAEDRRKADEDVKRQQHLEELNSKAKVEGKGKSKTSVYPNSSEALVKSRQKQAQSNPTLNDADSSSSSLSPALKTGTVRNKSTTARLVQTVYETSRQRLQRERAYFEHLALETEEKLERARERERKLVDLLSQAEARREAAEKDHTLEVQNRTHHGELLEQITTITIAAQRTSEENKSANARVINTDKHLISPFITFYYGLTFTYHPLAIAIRFLKTFS